MKLEIVGANKKSKDLSSSAQNEIFNLMLTYDLVEISIKGNASNVYRLTKTGNRVLEILNEITTS